MCLDLPIGRSPRLSGPADDGVMPTSALWSASRYNGSERTQPRAAVVQANQVDAAAQHPATLSRVPERKKFTEYILAFLSWSLCLTANRRSNKPETSVA